MRVGAAIDVIPDDLARVVDALGHGAFGAERIIDGGVGAATIEEGVRHLTAVEVIPDDLARVVDAFCNRAADTQRVFKGGVVAPAVEEAIVPAVALITPHDLASVVDAVCVCMVDGDGEAKRTRGGVSQGILDRRVVAPAVQKAEGA